MSPAFSVPVSDAEKWLRNVAVLCEQVDANASAIRLARLLCQVIIALLGAF
jgi:hypothetical protein